MVFSLLIGCIILLCARISSVHAFLTETFSTSLVRNLPSSSVSSARQPANILRAVGDVSIKSYEYNGWNLVYRYKPPSPGYEDSPPLLLVHPIGIGLSSWFWEQFLESWTGSTVYAPSLIGCGVSEGGDAWDPDKRGLSIPLAWVNGCEALMEIATTQYMDSSCLDNTKEEISWTVFAQGGLAPVGTMLAARNPESVRKLILASPPAWEDMTTAVPESELARNLSFFKSPILGNLAFTILESRRLIEFFSNQFLFSEPCDSRWLDNAEKELGRESRPPVMVFNSGFCSHRSFEDELRTLRQSTLILVGQDDKKQREKYVQYMKNCKLNVLPGQNVLPWEFPREVVEAVKQGQVKK